jgi:hypothetical protein
LALRHAPSLTSSLNSVEVETLPSHRVLLSRRSSVLWSPATSHPASSWISPLRLIPFVTLVVCQRPDEISPVPSSTVTTSRSPYAGEFFGAAVPDSSPLPWPSPRVIGSALPCPLRVNITTLQDSLDVTDCWFAPPSRRDTPLQHPRSSKSTGRLLRGLLAVTTTGLAPVSRR